MAERQWFYTIDFVSSMEMFKTWDRMNLPGLCSTKKFVVCTYRWRLQLIQYMSRATRHSLGLKHLLYSSHIPSHLSIVSFPLFCFSSHTSFHVLRRGSHYTSKPSLMLPPQERLSSALRLSVSLSLSFLTGSLVSQPRTAIWKSSAVTRGISTSLRTMQDCRGLKNSYGV